MRTAKEVQLETFCSMLKAHELREVSQVDCKLCYEFKPVVEFDSSFDDYVYYFCENCIKIMKEKNNES